MKSTEKCANVYNTKLILLDLSTYLISFHTCAIKKQSMQYGLRTLANNHVAHIVKQLKLDENNTCKETSSKCFLM